MIASRSLYAAAVLFAAPASVSLADSALAATTTATPDASPHHHHHHKAQEKAGSGTASSGKAAPHHHGSTTGATAAKTHAGTKKSAGHAEKPHHKPHTPKHVHHTGPTPGAPVTTPLPEDGEPANAPDATQNGANGQPDVPKGTNTGLPLPRFASLRADKVNMRAGPGDRYPIQWVYHRRGLPVQIEREFDVWRLVEDSDGVKGWVHQATLAGARDFVIPSPAGPAPAAPAQQAPAEDKPQAAAEPEQQAARHTESRILGHVRTVADAADISGAVILRASGDNDASPVAVLAPGTVGTLKTCASGSAWCRVSVRQYDGWLRRSAIWGLSADEAYPPS
ncbi:SH3 domain-containing protein [Acetobacter oeni]|uniref:SH3b domain-containing protein n=1 Tax=Acetobacter oeni TaxID=304077 RepID=A0A511XQG7_9PROT|nr:SH3 domain-containing protein [Acetobacter oeni]MBB3883710.1 SH3-like domain-containing protein [Acetobacter oeni]NHO19709.1 RNA-binding protein [Acetobacter oeni]GBR06146.1 hypothetical protein AA21952_1933 [Acetobacter oeni LMG 21952]GEN65185.1 hypothetical protein AOE01nite_34090 [Acetobacter oeni]